jgi:hypothetical protein
MSPGGAAETLYMDAKIRRDRKQLVEQAADLDAALTSSASKVSYRSKRLTLERTEKELESALTAVEENGQVSVLGLAKVLREFGTFRSEAGMKQVERERKPPCRPAIHNRARVPASVLDPAQWRGRNSAFRRDFRLP